ncbi:hypothetical protein TWF718_008491 [Orbilia javanica]|uniref:5'-3' DNA helicase ZGRF1-like N-terminal domain-containing protein n=1 Tax=Orbilia javanica TaxID=47235 RepID=A0AAN8NUB9_9PEZI
MSFASIPLTSHSAPIDEYIVLWTADKYKKLKKWHDGYLRYHTFNKRLMVYDHLMNKVCDKFLPEPEQMDVGDELIFDSHLVTIEDIKGRQAQDLRPLFEKTVDRRRERGSTTTPNRVVGTPTPSGQSPTPTLLRSIQSRPSTGHGRPVYPSPAPRLPPKEPESGAVVPQKRTSQGAPVVQRISYKPLKVSRVEDKGLGPAQAKKRRQGDDSGVNGQQKESAEPSPDLGLATNLLDADDDVEFLELDLERSDFATRPRPPNRVRPNAPPPFKPPRPQNSARKNIAQPEQAEEAPPPPPTPPQRTPIVAQTSQATNLLKSSPIIPPSTITNHSQELLSSPSFRRGLNAPSLVAQGTPKKDTSSPAQSPSLALNQDLQHEELQEIQESGRLTLPSATSRTRRRLLCGPSGRRNGASNMVSLSRPASTLSILDTFPKDDDLSKSAALVKGGKKPQKEARLSISSPETNLEGALGRASAKDSSPIGRNPSKQTGHGQLEKGSAPNEHWKPLLNRNNDSNSKDSASSNAKKSLDVDTLSSPTLEQNETPSKKSPKKTSNLCIFSSDEEGFEAAVSKPVIKRTRRSPPQYSGSSSDEFEQMRSSAVPKHLVGKSRDVTLQSRQAVSEASRVWKERESE